MKKLTGKGQHLKKKEVEGDWNERDKTHYLQMRWPSILKEKTQRINRQTIRIIKRVNQGPVCKINFRKSILLLYTRNNKLEITMEKEQYKVLNT